MPVNPSFPSDLGTAWTVPHAFKDITEDIPATPDIPAHTIVVGHEGESVELQPKLDPVTGEPMVDPDTLEPIMEMKPVSAESIAAKTAQAINAAFEPIIYAQGAIEFVGEIPDDAFVGDAASGNPASASAQWAAAIVGYWDGSETPGTSISGGAIAPFAIIAEPLLPLLQAKLLEIFSAPPPTDVATDQNAKATEIATAITTLVLSNVATTHTETISGSPPVVTPYVLLPLT